MSTRDECGIGYNLAIVLDMLCSKFKHFILTKSTLHNNVQFRCFITSRIILKKWIYIDGLLASITKKEISVMSPLRILLKDLRVWNSWTRGGFLSTVVRRCRRDRGVRDVIQCFRQALFRPKRTLLISATAAYKARGDDDDDSSYACDKSISDLELQELLNDLQAVEILSKRTLFCAVCGKRLVIDKKLPGVRYCSCKQDKTSVNSQVSEQTDADGWVPYMEAEDVIIWRKEYKPGLGLFAYKVYGRYPEVRAADFAAVQVDGAYRRVWDAAVAALAVVERGANGLADQAVLHWEVLWPRLFANRDYVYIRRHKEFDVVDRCGPQKDGLFQQAVPIEDRPKPTYTERPSVHSKAKRKAMEAYAMERDRGSMENKVYVIVNRSCSHPKVPETKHAIRVCEYWSHMVVKTINGNDKSGMEFVLTYYDEPAVGGMPSSVAAWASGRAAPAYLQRMRRAASDYRAWRRDTCQEIPEFTPFVAESSDGTETNKERAKEEDMESSQHGPELESDDTDTRDQSTQTDESEDKVKVKVKNEEVTEDKKHEEKVTEDTKVETKHEVISKPVPGIGDTPKCEEEEPNNGAWWRYLYPFYYFV